MTTTTAGVRPPGERGSVRLPGLAWVTWRQHRAALAGLAVVACGIAVVAIVSGLRIHSAFAPYVSAHCAAGWRAIACSGAANRIVDYKEGTLTIALQVLPVLIGVFLGAPLLAREIETGTARFAWTQAAGRTRWMLVKLVLLAAAVIVVCAALGVLAGWWLHPFDAVGVSSRWQAGEFGVTPVALVGWGLLGFTIGVCAGALIKRTVAAMAATAVAITALLGLAVWKLSNLILSLAPVTGHALPFGSASGLPGPGMTAMNTWSTASTGGPTAGGWLVRGWFTGATGHPLTGAAYERVVNGLMGGNTGRQPNPGTWLARHHDALLVAYQPAGRFWVFQTAAGAVFLLAALILTAATITIIRRRG